MNNRDNLNRYDITASGIEYLPYDFYVLCMSGNNPEETPLRTAWIKICVNTILLLKSSSTKTTRRRMHFKIPTQTDSESSQTQMDYTIATYDSNFIENDFIILWGHSYTPDVEEVFGMISGDKKNVPGPYSAEAIHKFIYPYIKKGGILLIYSCYSGGKPKETGKDVSSSQFMQNYDKINKSYSVYATRGDISTDKLLEAALTGNLNAWSNSPQTE